MLPWPVLLADFDWLDGRWAPLDGRTRPASATSAAAASSPRTITAHRAEHRLPDVRGSVLTGCLARELDTPASTPSANETAVALRRLVPAEVHRQGVPLAALHAFVIL